jgi:nucleolar protein 56
VIILIYVAFTPYGAFGVKDNKEVSSLNDIEYKKLFNEEEIPDMMFKLKTHPNKIAEDLKEEWGDEIKLEVVSAEPFNIGEFLRNNLFEVGKELGYFNNYDDFRKKMHYWGTELTKKVIKSYAQQKDKIIIQVAEAISDLDKTLNLLSERLREWYSLYFPELDHLVNKHEIYANLVTNLKKRENFTKSQLKKILPSKLAGKISEEAKNSMGGELEDYDLNAIVKFAEEISHLYEKRKELYDYLEKLMNEEAPNITKLAGVSLGARLIGLAGGLERLSKMPASTIQVLGAEKALFAHLRTGAEPPKHGIIYNHPLIQGSPHWQRGKIARALACKLAIAARADYAGDYIADELLEKLNKRVEDIKRKYPKPPKKKKKEKPKTKKKEKKSKKEKPNKKKNKKKDGKGKKERKVIGKTKSRK